MVLLLVWPRKRRLEPRNLTRGNGTEGDDIAECQTHTKSTPAINADNSPDIMEVR